MAETHACHICGLLDGDRETFVHQDESWSVVTMLDAPGILMIFTNKHNGGLSEISADAAAKFGPLIRTLSDELVSGAGYDWASLVQLGDTARHCHFMMLGRPKGDTAVFETKLMMQRLAERKDPAKTRALAEQLRRRLASPQ